MQAVCKTEEGAVCAECKMSAAGEALKCNKCTSLSHLRCSGLPVYHLVRLITTRSSYTCRTCVQAEESYKKNFDKIQQILDVENSKIAAIADESNTREEEDLTGSNAQPLEPSQGAETSEPPQIATRKRICRYYVKKTCKHGAGGDGCSYDHPKKCGKFILHAERNTRGCKLGKKCGNYHPPLCCKSRESGVCDREKCRYHHIRGTKFEKQKREEPVPIVTYPLTQRPRHLYSQVVSNRQLTSGPRPQEYPNVSVHARSNSISEDFLGLQQQVQAMQQQIQSVLSLVQKNQGNKEGPPCQCSQRGH